MSFDVALIVESVPLMLSGIGVTLKLLVVSAILGLLLAIVLLLMRISGRWYLDWPAQVYIYVFRGTPILVQIFIVYYGFPQFEFIRDSIFWPILREPTGCVLLIDEIDKADEEFEAFLLEILSDYQVTVPELGTIEAMTPPLVFLTSNNTREMSDALKRRCLHLHIPFPDRHLEQRIVEQRVPEVGERLRDQLVNFVQGLRELDLRKVPSVAETIDWARTLLLMHTDELGADIVRNTLNVLLKFEEDIEVAEKEVAQLVRQARDPNVLRSV